MAAHRPILDDSWRQWLCDNLLLGADNEQLIEALVGRGVPRAVADREVQNVKSSPLYASCQRFAEQRGQLKRRADVLSQLRRLADVERVSMLSEDEFFVRYYATNTPVLFTELLSDSPAIPLWTPGYLKQRYGDVEIEIVDGRGEDPDCDRRYEQNRRTTTMAAYVDRVLAAGSTNDFYFTARNNNIERQGLASLQHDIRPPSELFLPKAHARAQSFWFGPKGSITGTHHDPTNIMFCQIYGEKRVQLAPPCDPALLDLSDGFYHRAPSDLHSYPELADAAILEVTLSAGDALFIPALWWHRVEALSVSISYSLLHFKRQNRFADYRP